MAMLVYRRVNVSFLNFGGKYKLGGTGKGVQGGGYLKCRKSSQGSERFGAIYPQVSRRSAHPGNDHWVVVSNIFLCSPLPGEMIQFD